MIPVECRCRECLHVAWAANGLPAPAPDSKKDRLLAPEAQRCLLRALRTGKLNTNDYHSQWLWERREARHANATAN